MTQYRVEWKCLTSGTQSHGDWHNSKEFIQTRKIMYLK